LKPLAAFGLATSLVAAGGCSGGPTGPSLPIYVLPGLYVLRELDGNPAPFVVERARYGDTLEISLRVVFDSIRILNDSAFSRHFRRELIRFPQLGNPVLLSAEESSFGGLILQRGSEIKLTVTAGQLPGGHDFAYFTPLGDGTELERMTTFRGYRCSSSGCTLEVDRRVRTRYEQR